MLAYACKIYKVHGFRIPNVVICLDQIKQKTFNYRQMRCVARLGTTGVSQVF